MNLTTRFVVIGAVVLLCFAASARADTFQLIYSGAQISGNLTLSATNNGNGTETVVVIGGSQILNGQTQDVTGLIAPTSTPYSVYNGVFTFDNLIYTNGANLVDVYGLLFNVTHEANPVNICALGSNSVTSCGLPGEKYAELVYVGSGGNFGGGAYMDYGFTSLKLVQTPEPSTLLLTGLGLAGILFAFRRKPAHLRA